MLSNEEKIIGEITLDLHSAHSEELSCKLPEEGLTDSPKETDDYNIKDNIVSFPSIEARNRFLATYLFEKNKGAFQSDPCQWISTARILWRNEIGRADSAAGRLLALVHKIEDVCSITARAIKSEVVEVFDALSMVSASLPYLDRIEPKGVIELCIAQYERTKGDYASGLIFNSLEKVLTSKPDVCRSIHEYLKNDINEATANLHPTALLALAQSLPEEALTLALEDAVPSNALLRNVALWTLGRLIASSKVPEVAMPAVTASIITSLSDPVLPIRQSAIRAAALCLSFTDVFDEVLIKLGESGEQYVLAVIASQLMLNLRQIKGKANFDTWVRLLHKLSPLEHTVGNYDHVLRQLIEDEGKEQLAISCFTDWIRTNAKDLPKDKSVAKLFDSTVATLSKYNQLLSQVITDWLLSDERQLAVAVAGLLSHLWARGFKNPEFSTPKLDTLEQHDLLFLARRMLGFVAMEDQLLSLTLSILKTKDAPKRAFGIVYALLVDELGKDYPDSTIATLEKATNSTTDPDWQNYYSGAREAIKDRINELEALPRLAELRPPPHLVRQFAKARAEQMRNSAEEAQKGSIIRQIATEIPIKAGHGWFSFRDGSYTDTRHMQSFSQSVSLPRRHILDEVGYETFLLGLRLAKRGDE